MPKGYSTSFLEGNRLEMPLITKENELIHDHVFLPYTNFTVNFCVTRKVPVFTAVNIDGKNFVQINREDTPWRYEKELNKQLQIGEDFYKKTAQQFHKGHIVRRIDVSWGEEAEQGQEDTFHYTNACPQHRKFNPAIWLELERNILEKGAVTYDKKLSVFAGPVINKLDKPAYVKMNDELVFIPSVYWKVVIWNKEDGRRAAVGFMQSQKDLIDVLVDQNYGMAQVKRSMDIHMENMKFKNDAVYQVSINNIEKATGLKFSLDNIYQPPVPGNNELKEQITETGERMRSFRAIKTGPISIAGMILD